MDAMLIGAIVKLIGLTMMGVATIGFAKQKDNNKYKGALEDNPTEVKLIVQPPRKRRG